MRLARSSVTHSPAAAAAVAAGVLRVHRLSAAASQRTKGGQSPFIGGYTPTLPTHPPPFTPPSSLWPAFCISLDTLQVVVIIGLA